MVKGTRFRIGNDRGVPMLVEVLTFQWLEGLRCMSRYARD
jgi:hypothetical protein